MDRTRYKEIRRFLAEIPNINRGGCLYAAYGVYLWLKKNDSLPANFAIVGLDNDEDGDGCYATNRQFIKNKAAKTLPMNHFGWTFGRVAYDPRKKITEKYKRRLRIKGGMIEPFCTVALRENRWNPDFDTANVKKIEEKLGVSFFNNC